MANSANRTHISAEMAAAVGSTLGRRVSFPVSDSDIRRWALATYHPRTPPARFLRAATPDALLIAPEEFNPFAWIVAEQQTLGDGIEGHDPDRTEKSVGVSPPGLARQLNGGMSVEYGVPVRSGDVVTSVLRLGGYHERESRLGLMLLTALEDVWTNQDGALVKTMTRTLIRY